MFRLRRVIHFGWIKFNVALESTRICKGVVPMTPCSSNDLGLNSPINACRVTVLASVGIGGNIVAANVGQEFRLRLPTRTVIDHGAAKTTQESKFLTAKLLVC